AFLVAAIILVLAVGNDARRRSHRQKRLLHFRAPEHSLEIFDVALELRLPGIGDRPDADRVRARGDLFARIELGVEFGEALPIGPRLKRVCPGLPGTTLEAAQAFERVLRPADRFAEFAVADHVDTDLGLAPNDRGDGFGQAPFIRFAVEGFSRLLRAQEGL